MLEIEIILNTVYLHILEMGNSTYKQKSMVLQALLKICENPQTLIDIFLNYDCNLGAVSVFERIVNVCARCAQGGRIDGTDEGGSASSPGNTSSSSSSTSTTAAATSKTSSGGGLMGLAATTAFGLTGLVGEYVGVGTSKAEAIRLQEKRLKIRSLLCLVAIVNSLVEWSIQIAPKVPIVGAGGKLMLPDSGSSTGSSSSQDSSPTSAKNTNASLSNGALYGSRKGSLVNLTTATVSNGSNYVIVAVENGSSGGENSITTSTSSRSFLDALGPANQSHPVLVDKRPLNSVSLTKATVVGAKLASQAGSTGIVSSTSNINGCSDDTAASQIEEMTSRKQQLRQCIKLFNSKPNKGVKQMIEAGFTTDDPVECARFLKSTQGLVRRN